MPPAAVAVGARVAVPEDLEALTAMAVAAREPLGSVRGGAVLLAGDARTGDEATHLAHALADQDHLVTVGLLDDVVVGYASAVVVHTPGGTSVAEIEELYVDPEARQIGVGASVLRSVITWAEEQGCTGIDAVALPGDRATKNFFEGHGLVARAIIAHRALDAGARTP